MPASLAFSRGGGRALRLPALNRSRTKSWFNGPDLADLAAIADFNADRYAIPALPAAEIAAAPAAALLAKRACSFAEWFSFTAAGSGLRSYVDAGGQWRSDLAANAPRFDWSNGRRQLALNDLATNLVPNARGLGAAAGTPGILPTGWFAQAAGLTVSVMGSGTEDGMPFLDIRYRGVSGANYGIVSFGNLTGITAGAHSLSAYLRLVGGAASGISFSSLRFRYSLNDGASVDAAAPFSLAAGPLRTGRITASDTVAAAANGGGSLFVQFNWTVGVTLDFTIRLALPQLEPSPFASPAIATVGTSQSRASEIAALADPVAALLQRPAASVILRGQSMLRPGGILLGATDQAALLRASATRTQLVSEGVAALTTAGGSDLATASWAAGLSFDAAGRSLARDGASLASDANPVPQGRGSLWLARSASGRSVGDGCYDWVGIAPTRLSNARLMQLCRPA